jgi:hypothetical protein
MFDVCKLDNDINGLKIRLDTCKISEAIGIFNEDLGNITCNIFKQIDLSAEILNIYIGLKKCDSKKNGCNCHNNEKDSKSCKNCDVYHMLYLLREKNLNIVS